jgi:hypothetical protein
VGWESYWIVLPIASPPPPVEKKRKLGKNPTVDTSFLPDRDREVSGASHVTFASELAFDWLVCVSCCAGGRAAGERAPETGVGTETGKIERLV